MQLITEVLWWRGEGFELPIHTDSIEVIDFMNRAKREKLPIRGSYSTLQVHGIQQSFRVPSGVSYWSTDARRSNFTAARQLDWATRQLLSCRR